MNRTVCSKLKGASAARTLAVAFLTLSGTPLWAQAAETDTTSGVQDIIVTAQRKQENLQDVPISVAAISGDSLKSQGISRSQDLEFATPGLIIPADVGVSSAVIRGVGTGFTGEALESSVSVYSDDIYIQNQTGQLQDLLDVKQVQVIKGPQGVLYGRNATGGAILITTNQPDASAFSGHVEVEGGTHGARRGEAVVNAPLSSTAAVRIAGSYDRIGAYIKNIANRPNANEDKGKSINKHIRGTLKLEPMDAMTILVSGDYQHRREDLVRQQRSTGALCTTCLVFGDPSTNGFYTTVQNNTIPILVKNFTGALTVKYEFDSIELASFTSYQNVEVASDADVDLGPSELLYFTSKNPPVKGRTVSQDFRITSSYDGAFNFASGLSYLHNSSDRTSSLHGLAFAGVTPDIVYHNGSKTDSFSGYLEGYFQPTEAIKLTVGGRYSVDERSYTLANNSSAAAIVGGGIVSFADKASFSNFTPRVVLAYDQGWLNAYASYNKGFKSGGYSLPASAPTAPLKSETIDAWEIGAKMKLFDNRVRLNLAAYHFTWKNMQVVSVDPVTSAQSLLNAASSKSTGFEAETQIVLSDMISLNGAAQYQDPKFKSFRNAPFFIPGAAGFISTTADLSGERLPNAPKFSAQGGAQLKIPAGDWNFEINGAWRYSTSFDFFPGASGPLRADRQKSFTVVNLSGEVQTPVQMVTLTWSISNATNVKYLNQRGTTGFGVYDNVAPPRIIRGGVRVSF